MESINDDCLLKIFSYCSLKQRLKLEQVCKRWRSMTPYSDISSEFTTLDILMLVRWKPHHVVKVKHGPCAQCDHEATAFIRQSALMEALAFYLSRLGKWSTGISFNCSCALACIITPDVLEMVHNYAPHVSRFTFDRCVIMDSAFNFLTASFQVSDLTLAYSTFINGDDCVVIDGCDLIRDFVTKSSENLAKLELRGMKRSRLRFSNCYGKLTTIVLVDCYIMAADFKALITSNCKSIKRLEISSCGSISRFDCVAQLEELTSLIVRQSMMNVSDFAMICSNCKHLEALRLESCPRLLDLSSARDLSSLKQLSIMGKSMKIEDHVLEDLMKNGKIEKLEIIDCMVSDEAFRRLIPYANKLLSFSVQGTRISTSTLNAIRNKVNRSQSK